MQVDSRQLTVGKNCQLPTVNCQFVYLHQKNYSPLQADGKFAFLRAYLMILSSISFALSLWIRIFIIFSLI